MKRRWTRGVMLSGLLLVGLAPAQREVSIYGGVYRSSQPVSVEVYAPAGTVFTLSRVLDPAALFAASPDPHEPRLGAARRSAPIRTITLKKRDQRLDFGKLPSGVYVVGTGKLGAVVLVSNLGLVVKRDAGQALTFAADRESGQTRAARVWALGAGPQCCRAPMAWPVSPGKRTPIRTRRPSWPATATTGPSAGRTGTATRPHWCAVTSTRTARFTAPASMWSSRRCCVRRAN
ncbi:hypothetical protein ACFP9V_19945 [Deinococcus radiopugnans]|uniref:hypothetical protein n=1 Tax=Deinococcus radiopugnans TaxID=57497 RepID=UPI003612ED3E